VPPKMLAVGCVEPKMELVAGATDVTAPNGLAVAAAGVPNIEVVDDGVGLNEKGVAAGAVAAKN
jgi:hypothetical protein